MHLGVLEGQTRGYYFLDSIFSISVKQHTLQCTQVACIYTGMLVLYGKYGLLEKIAHIFVIL